MNSLRRQPTAECAHPTAKPERLSRCYRIAFKHPVTPWVPSPKVAPANGHSYVYSRSSTTRSLPQETKP
eukprot:7772269-Pyramimonas_sp.AAC.1